MPTVFDEIHAEQGNVFQQIHSESKQGDSNLDRLRVVNQAAGLPQLPDFSAGMLGSLGEHAANVYDLIRKIPGADKILPDSAKFREAIKNSSPDTVPAHVGRFLETAGEFALPAGKVAEATKGAGLLTRMAAQGATSSGVAGLQSGGDKGQMLTAGATGALAEPLGDLFSFAASKLPGKLYQSALKPTRAMMEDNPNLIDVGLESHLPVSPASLGKIAAGIDDLRQQINQGVQAHAGSTIDPKNVVSALDELRGIYANSANPSLSGGVDSIDALKQDFLNAHSGGIPLEKAQQMKINTYKILRNAYGDMKSAEVEGTKQIARGLKEQIETVFPEIAGLNRAQSEQLGLEDAMTRAVWRMENRDMLPTGLSVAAGVGHAVGAGAPAGMIAKALDMPEVKSRIALALATKGVRNANQLIADRIANIAAVANAAESK